MAYNAQQKRSFARELARAGGNVALALKALREDHETFRKLGERTLHRFQQEPDAPRMIAEAFALQKAAWEAEAVVAERERAKGEYRGSERARMDEVAALIDSIHSQIKGWAESDDEKLRPAFLSLYERLLRIHDARLIKMLPCISDQAELTVVLRVMGQELQSELGPRAGAFIERMHKSVIEAIHEHKKKTATVTPPVGA